MGSSRRAEDAKVANTTVDPESAATEIPAEGILMPDGKRYTNFSTLESAGSYRTLNSSTTGCYAENGSMPILLASNDLCNKGFFCPNSTDKAPPQYVIQEM